MPQITITPRSVHEPVNNHAVLNKKGAGEYPNYPSDLAGYSGLWDPHHCISGQSPALPGYPDILTAFNSDLGTSNSALRARLIARNCSVAAAAMRRNGLESLESDPAERAAVAEED